MFKFFNTHNLGLSGGEEVRKSRAVEIYWPVYFYYRRLTCWIHYTYSVLAVYTTPKNINIAPV